MKTTVRITVLVENTTSDQKLSKEHGWALWVEYGEHRILLDTGQSDILLSNAQVLGIDPHKAGAIVISHGHYDHTGGLMGVLNKTCESVLYLHPDALKPKFSCRGDKPGRSIGMPVSTLAEIRRLEEENRVVRTEGPTEVFPGIWLTGAVSRTTDFEDVGGPFFLDANGEQPDILSDDQAMFFESERGMVVVLGCAHAGVVNTLRYVFELSGQKQIYAVLGGMHLMEASEERIEKTIEAFREYNVKWIGPAHCTGEEATRKIRNAFPDRCFSCSTGEQIDF